MSKRGNAVGIDGVMNEVVKYGGELVTTFLRKLCDMVFESENFPAMWSQGLIRPLFKGVLLKLRVIRINTVKYLLEYLTNGSQHGLKAGIFFVTQSIKFGF